MNNKENKIDELDSFAVQLFNSLNAYGYLFPKTVNEVDSFETLYGQTPIQTPSFEALPIPNRNFSNNFEFGMAAYNSAETDDFQLPDDVDLNFNKK